MEIGLGSATRTSDAVKHRPELSRAGAAPHYELAEPIAELAAPATSNWAAPQELHIRASQPGSAALLRILLDSFITFAMLLAAALWFEAEFTVPYVILALLAVALTLAFRSSGSPVSISHSGRAVVARWCLIISLLLLLGWSTQTLDLFNSQVMLAWATATPLVQFAAHRCISQLLAPLFATQGVQRTAVIAGANGTGCVLARHISADPLLALRFAGYFDDRDCGRLHGVNSQDLRGSLDQLAEFVKTNRIDVVYCALPCSAPRIRRLLESLHDTTASVYFAPDVLSFGLIQARVDTLAGVPVIALCESPFCGVNALVKRVSDLVLASLILLMIAPLCLAIALGVKLSSPGPVLFKQRRYGVDGREIVVYKFRTMTCLEDGQEIRQAMRDDPRITRFGRILRQYSLDELPQFINVLQGRMSIVGPRPHAIAHNEMYRKLIPGYMIRHKVKPGITGLAQVRGLRGETDTVDKMRARIECDLEYLRDWSLLLDLSIVLKTIGVVLGRKNAY